MLTLGAFSTRVLSRFVENCAFLQAGSHESSNWSCFYRELGMGELSAISLHPELVVLAGVETGKLRAICKSKK